MLSSNISLPFPYRLINSVGKLLISEKIPIAQLDEDLLHNAAMKLVNLTDFGYPYYREGLARLLESVQKYANLNFLGRLRVHELIVNCLANRLLMTDFRKRTPEIFSRPLIPPIIVTGMFRSGTTLLHRLLASDPVNRGIPLWALIKPFLRNQKEIDHYRNIVTKRLKIAHTITPDMDVKHFIRVDEPEECTWALGMTFTSLIFPIIAPVYSYVDWYLTQDRVKKYQEYRWILQFYQSYEPTRRLVLKAPEHLSSVTELRQAIPNVLIIQMHRDPVQCINSHNSLRYTLHSPITDNLDVSRMAEMNLRTMGAEMDRLLVARKAHPGTVFDVSYEKLVADPIGTVKGIYEHFELAWSEAYEEVLNSYLRNNHKGKHGTHYYCATDFGLTDAKIAARFEAYIERFGTPYL
jgi:hypothetical protein